MSFSGIIQLMLGANESDGSIKASYTYLHKQLTQVSVNKKKTMQFVNTVEYTNH